ncbi:unnamed protein product [Prorocentrum cordatum]|uniref:histidine kinase n=1 Tax=Prorocentrum cordatum TaxID=2364126 RepID=A0ABN9SXA2_9DINO|nr:unnamed protein product [Polarella glacialis]
MPLWRIFGIDTRGLVTEWNHMFYKIPGFEKQGVLGKPMIQTFIHVDQQDSVQEVFKRAMSGEDIANFEFQLYTNNGQVRDLSINATPRIGYYGEITGVFGVGQDVTEVNAQRKELERVAGNLRCTVDYANAPIIGVNVQCLVNEFNFKAAQLSGFSKEEILGKSLVNTLVSPDKRPSVSFALLRALGGQESSVLEFPLTTKDGDQRELTMNFTALRGATGDMEGVICVGTDITEMKQMAAQQKFIAEDFQRVIRSANAPIIGVNIHGQVNEWNDKAAELSGYSKEEALGKELVETFIRAEYQPAVSVAIRNACRGIDASQVEFPLIARDGSQVLLSLNAASRTDQWGSIIGMVGVGQDITNLHQAMEEIAASRDEVTAVAEDLRRTIDHANAPILGIDTQGRVTEWNRKMAEITEFGKEEMLGKPLIEDFIMKEYQEQVGRVLKQAMDGTETDNYEFSIVSKSGSRREILLNAATRRGPEGKVTGVISIGQDITKIKAVTAHMERVADDLSRLIETANAPIFAVNKECKVTEWNRKCEEILGYPKADAMGQHLVRKFIHEVNRKSVRTVLNRALANDEVKNFELTFYTREGAQRDVLLSATPRWGQEHEIIGVVCVGQDVTEMKKHRDNAQRVADDYSRLINTANAPIFGVDESACVTEWNNWVAVKSGFVRSETQGKKLTNYIAEKSQGVWLDVLRDASKGNPTETFEVELAPKDPDNQKCVSLLLNATPRIDPQGDIIGVICVGQDITSIREMEQRKAAFMAVVSHELRSPLNGIMGLSSGLVENAVEGSSFHKQLSLIHNCASRLLDMVNNIMDAGSLVQDRKMRLSCENVYLEKIVEEVVVLCQNSADRHGKKLVKEGVTLMNHVTELPVITADPYRCTQLVYNLVTNALKFTAKGHVRVFATADHVAETVTVTVEDTGIGIAAEKLERIFQPFEQEDQSSTRHFEGLGLGLSICREVAIKHGGTLTVDSEKGKGSQFHVSFPFEMNPGGAAGQENPGTVAAPPTAVAAAPPTAVQRRLSIPDDPDSEDLDASIGDGSEAALSESEANSDASAERPASRRDDRGSEGLSASVDDLQPRLTDKSPMVLSVDDEQVAQKSLASWFEMNGIRFVCVSNADSCLEHFRSGKVLPDLVLLDDLMQEGMNGVDTLTDIRKLYNVFEVPVIIVSSRKSTNAVVKGLGRMCNDWVHKPFDRRELLARVKFHLNLKELVRERLSQVASSDKLLEVIPSPVAELSHALVDRTRQRMQANERELHELQRKVAKARAERATLAGSINEARRALANLRQDRAAACGAVAAGGQGRGGAARREAAGPRARGAAAAGQRRRGRPACRCGAAAGGHGRQGLHGGPEVLAKLIDSRMRAHMELDSRQRESQISALQEKLKHQSELAASLQERCFQLERALRHMQVDAPIKAAQAFF